MKVQGVYPDSSLRGIWVIFLGGGGGVRGFYNDQAIYDTEDSHRRSSREEEILRREW